MGRQPLVDQHDLQNVTEVELNDLRQKFQLLEGDRKAYYEMSMHTMKENKKIIAQLRGQTKEVRKQLAEVQRQSRASATTAKLGGSEKNDIADLTRHVSLLRKNHDTLRSNVEAKRKELTQLRDQAADLELESERPNADDSPLTRKIRMLENRLDKAMIKYNEAQSIRKTYEQIVKRLKEERVGFDNQLAAIERTLKAKQHDYEELLLLSADANHARDVATQEQERVRTQLSDARKRREREVREKRELVSVKSDMASRMEKREQMRQNLMSKANGELDEIEEENLKSSLAMNTTFSSNKISEETKNHRAKIDVYEEAFRKIKEATGVSDVNEVIQKIVSQEDTQNNLAELTAENHTRIESMTSERASLKQRVEEIKYSGTGGGHRRKMVDDHEEALTQSSAKLERCRLKYERLAKILINVKAGINHLSDKVEVLREDGRHIVMNDDTVVDVLSACESSLVAALHRVKSDGDGDGMTDDEARLTMHSQLDDSEEIAAARPFNQRVALPDGNDELDNGPGLGDGGEADIDFVEEQDGDEELTRDRIKKASNSIMQQHERRMRKSRKPNTADSSVGQAPKRVGRGSVASRSKRHLV